MPAGRSVLPVVMERTFLDRRAGRLHRVPMHGARPVDNKDNGPRPRLRYVWPRGRHHHQKVTAAIIECSSASYWGTWLTCRRACHAGDHDLITPDDVRYLQAQMERSSIGLALGPLLDTSKFPVYFKPQLLPADYLLMPTPDGDAVIKHRAGIGLAQNVLRTTPG
jgi:hypothetical protein